MIQTLEQNYLDRVILNWKQLTEKAHSSKKLSFMEVLCLEEGNAAL